jgi:riboflavin kinase/FMN adenylyltransferase
LNVLTGPLSSWEAKQPSSVTIGVFDGVHLGHRALISRLRPDLVKTVLTFEPHPVEILRPGTPPRLITTVDERVELMEGAGVSQVGILDLGEIKDLDPEEFVEDVLLARLGLHHLVLGPDFRFGRDRSGDVALLRDLGRQHGFAVETIEIVSDQGGPISSSRIRRLIEGGQVAAAALDLGSRFRVTAEVIPGDKRGAAIGYPTANMAPPTRKVIPAPGVYAAFARVRGNVERAAVNVGYRPTFGGGDLLIEAFILDFNERIYGEEITVEFVERLRDEIAFSNVDDLIERMGDDVAETEKILESTSANVG